MFVCESSIVKVKFLEESVKEVPEFPVFSPSVMEERRKQLNASRVLESRRVNPSASAEALGLFEEFSRVFGKSTCIWDKQSILIHGNIVIDPPYDTCRVKTGIKSDTTSAVEKMLMRFKKKLKTKTVSGS
jgi:hypothetical protein